MNVIYVLADNECHEFEDLLDSIYSINELIIEQNESFFHAKGFDGKEDFLTKSKNLGGIIFDNRTNEKKLWINSNANVLLSEEIKEFVRSLNE
jgi:hypothetical protein